ncbi:MAG: hypothetical protein KBT11_09490 [Treponema sp.]|nr:hypothetical protein [Candidatus Treponema equifaecale]
MKTELYNYDNKDLYEKELSDTAIRKWYNGANFPELPKLLRLSRLLGIVVEDIIVYRIEFIEVENKKTKSKSKSTEIGTKVHSFCKEIYFEEENLTMEELQKKYAEDFEDLLFKNNEYVHRIYEGEFNESFAFNDELFLLADFNPKDLKDNVIKAIELLSYSNRIFQRLFNTYRQKINAWKSKYTNPKSDLPDNQKKLAAIPETEYLLSLLKMTNMKVAEACNIQYFAQRDKKFDLDQFEAHYERIANKKSFEEQYRRAVEERRNIIQLYLEFSEAEYNEEAEDYDQQSLEKLVYSLDESLPETLLKKKLNHDVLMELRKNYETKIAKYDLSFEPGTFSLASYLLERAKKEKIFDEEDFEKFKEYVLYMVYFKEMDDYEDYMNSIPKEDFDCRY